MEVNMPQYIKHRLISRDPWTLLNEANLAAVPALGDVIVPVALWRAHGATLADRPGRVGVWLAPDDAPSDDLASLPVIAIHFPQFTDGRGYSIARLLRGKHHFKGELRAFGDVLRDQLYYMARCGFDAFVLRDDQDIQATLAAFNDFSENYHSAADDASPAFGRHSRPVINP
jgi:uncharacterized protein (DUF934 family)